MSSSKSHRVATDVNLNEPIVIEGALVGAVVEGLQYVKGLSRYVPKIIRDEGQLPFVKTVSSEMRAKQSETTRYVVLLVIMQLSDFANEAVMAFNESRSIMLPKPKNDVDYTVATIWRQFNELVLNEYNTISDWKSSKWNPYEQLLTALDALILHIGQKHFGLATYEEGEEEDDGQESASDSGASGSDSAVSGSESDNDDDMSVSSESSVSSVEEKKKKKKKHH